MHLTHLTCYIAAIDDVAALDHVLLSLSQRLQSSPIVDLSFKVLHTTSVEHLMREMAGRSLAGAGLRASTVQALVHAHGAGIRRFQLSASFAPDGLSALLRSCPRLEHLSTTVLKTNHAPALRDAPALRTLVLSSRLMHVTAKDVRAFAAACPTLRTVAHHTRRWTVEHGGGPDDVRAVILSTD